MAATSSVGQYTSPQPSLTKPLLLFLSEETPESSKFFERCWKLMGKDDVKPEERTFLLQISRVVFIQLVLYVKNERPIFPHCPPNLIYRLFASHVINREISQNKEVQNLEDRCNAINNKKTIDPFRYIYTYYVLLAKEMSKHQETTLSQRAIFANEKYKPFRIFFEESYDKTIYTNELQFLAFRLGFLGASLLNRKQIENDEVYSFIDPTVYNFFATTQSRDLQSEISQTPFKPYLASSNEDLVKEEEGMALIKYIEGINLY